MSLNDWLTRLRKPPRRSRRHTAAFPQALESRTLLTVFTEFGSENGELEVRSNAGDDITITSSEDGGDVLINGESTGVNPTDVKSLEVRGGKLANRIDLTGVTDEVFTSLDEVEVKGNAGDDVIIGSEFDEELRGGAGNDDIQGNDGDDEVKGDLSLIHISEPTRPY